MRTDEQGRGRAQERSGSPAGRPEGLVHHPFACPCSPATPNRKGESSSASHCAAPGNDRVRRQIILMITNRNRPSPPTDTALGHIPSGGSVAKDNRPAMRKLAQVFPPSPGPESLRVTGRQVAEGVFRNRKPGAWCRFNFFPQNRTILNACIRISISLIVLPGKFGNFANHCFPRFNRESRRK